MEGSRGDQGERRECHCITARARAFARVFVRARVCCHLTCNSLSNPHCYHDCFLGSKLLSHRQCSFPWPAKGHCPNIQLTELTPITAILSLVSLSSIEMQLRRTLKPVRNGVVLRHAIKKARSQTSPGDDVRCRDDSKVGDPITLVQNGHAPVLKRSLCAVHHSGFFCHPR